MSVRVMNQNSWQTPTKKKRAPRKKPAPNQEPVEVISDDWFNRFDAIDHEIYAVLVCFYPEAIDSETILQKLQWMNPHENKTYRLQDVWDSLDICLKPYLVEESKNRWTLLSK